MKKADNDQVFPAHAGMSRKPDYPKAPADRFPRESRDDPLTVMCSVNG